MTLDNLSFLRQRIPPLVWELVGLVSKENLACLLDVALSADTIGIIKSLREIRRTLSKKEMENLCQALRTISGAKFFLRLSNEKSAWLTTVLLPIVLDQHACRTAICKTNKGGFKDTHAEDLLALLRKAPLEKTKLNLNEVGDIVVGTVLAPGSQRALEGRMAAFYAGFPEIAPLRTVNPQCSSGLQVVADVAAAIKARYHTTDERIEVGNVVKEEDATSNSDRELNRSLRIYSQRYRGIINAMQFNNKIGNSYINENEHFEYTPNARI